MVNHGLAAPVSNPGLLPPAETLGTSALMKKSSVVVEVLERPPAVVVNYRAEPMTPRSPSTSAPDSITYPVPLVIVSATSSATVISPEVTRWT